jgi:uncharacterized protein
MKFSIVKRLIGLAGVAAIAYLATCIGIRYAQNRLIFLPSAEIGATPGDLGLSYQDVWLPVKIVSKVERIHGWWMPAPKGEKALLYLHGNGLNISANVDQAKRFQQMGLSVLLIDYRGYGRSEGGFPTEASVYEDAETAWNYLTQQRGIDPAQIIIYGHSLGGAIAIHLASQHPNASRLIVQSSFTSMAAMGDLRGWSRFLPQELLLTQRFDSLARVKNLKMPVFYLHGTADTLIPDQMSAALAAATPNAKLLLIPGGGHNNLAEIGGDRYLEAIRHFVTPKVSGHAEKAEGVGQRAGG